MKTRLTALSFCALVLAAAPAARAHWISGFVYCDEGDGAIGAGDTPVDGVEVQLQSLTTSATYFDLTGDAIPDPSAPGQYRKYLPEVTDSWDVRLTGAGLPAGSSVLLPAGGAHTVNLIAGSYETGHADNVNFLLGNCQPKCTPESCDDGNSCTADRCEPATGCLHDQACLFTRTPGFYKNHPSVTQGILDAAGGLDVCGQHITNTASDDAHSALEALCVAVHGTTNLQLARQLMAAALNGAAGGNVFGNFALCNAACTDPNATQAQITQCIESLNAYNNAGDDVPAPFDGSAGETGTCQAARDTACVIPTPAFCAIQ